jgi:nucleoside-diphosphate-sugar epimerase
MRYVVTGAAGFVGSHLCATLLGAGHSVVGLDSFMPYYPREIKERNLVPFREHDRFRFHALDLRTDVLPDAVAGADAVFHLAAMPGLKRSWTDFDLYNGCNVTATHRLLEAVRQAGTTPKRFIHVSTSSVYGRFASGDETLPTAPISPYGVTKLAAEHLCRAYADAHGLPLVVLRYFSVYGPGQRPDMGYHQFINALLRDEPVVVTGDGHQTRSNTYVADCVDATVAALEAPVGETYNVGGGESASVWDVLRILENLAGRAARVRQEPARLGDQRSTFADTRKLLAHLGFRPRTPLSEGLARQWHWQKERLSESGRC